ncbi:MAG: proline dehydrogenase family protein [Euzebyales bacterium]|nr:proline dehydrogenase family protein [Euzebyales bacterium]
MSALGRRILFGLATADGLERLVRRTAPAQARAYAAARRYVAGTTIDDAVQLAGRLHDQGVATSIDCFGEQVTQTAEAEAVAREYVALATRLGDLADSVWLSIDLSHVGLDLSTAFCRRQLAEISAALPHGRRLQVGAEDAARTDTALDVVTALAVDGAPLTMTVQANLRRSPEDARRLTDAGVPIRLVKGAYVESAAAAHAWGEETDLAFLRLAHQLHDAGARFAIATHDPVIREALLAAFGPIAVEMLLGVRSDDAIDLVSRGVPVRVYVPYGDDWFRYWMRRLAESRGA